MRNVLITLLVIICTPQIFATVPPAERVYHKVSLAWTAPNGIYSNINIYRQDCNPACNNFVLLKTLGKVTTFTDDAVIGGVTYFYYATSVYKGLESTRTNITWALIPY